MGWSDVGEIEWERAVDAVGGKRLVLVATVILDEAGCYPVRVWRGTGVGCVNVHERYLLSVAPPLVEGVVSVRSS